MKCIAGWENHPCEGSEARKSEKLFWASKMFSLVCACMCTGCMRLGACICVCTWEVCASLCVYMHM